MNRQTLRVSKFIKFKQSVNLKNIQNTLSFCVLFFSKTTLILRKSTFKRVREIKSSFERCLEIDYNLVFFSPKKSQIIKISMIDFRSQNFVLPPEHILISLEGCPTKKFLVGITRHRNLLAFSLVFWVWDNPNFLYIFDLNPPVENVKILGLNSLVVFGLEFTLALYDESLLSPHWLMVLYVWRMRNFAVPSTLPYLLVFPFRHDSIPKCRHRQLVMFSRKLRS